MWQHQSPFLPFLPSLPYRNPMAANPFFTPVKFLNKYEVLVGNTKYLYKSTTLYTLRDRESDDDYDPDELWRFAAWCGSPTTNSEHARVFAAAAAGRQKADGDCLICMDSFNLSDRKAIPCPACETPYCRTCIQTCLLQDTTARCQEPACRHSWTDEFLRGTMTKVFMNGPYKAHRQKVLLDGERIHLPETQEDALRYKTAREITEPIETQLRTIEESINALPSLKAHKRARIQYLETLADNTFRNKSGKEQDNILKALSEKERQLSIEMEKDRELLNKQKRKLRSDAYKTAKKIVENYGKLDTFTETEKKNANAWTFVMRCPSTTCEGFVGLDWKCGMCAQTVCKNCREVKGDTLHTCDPDKVASVKALAKEAKPCPKCAAMISKIDGCDQMWCTQCHTAFSWRTGNVETYIHNPHYFQWMRQSGQQIPAVPQQLQQGAAAQQECLQPEDIFRMVQRNYPNTPALEDWIQRCMHVNEMEHRRWRHTVRSQANEHAEKKRILRVKRLVKEIDDAEWAKKLQQYERDDNRARRFFQIYDMFVNTAADMIRPLLNHSVRMKEEQSVLANIISLGGYVDEEIIRINREFNCLLGYCVSVGTTVW